MCIIWFGNKNISPNTVIHAENISSINLLSVLLTHEELGHGNSNREDIVLLHQKKILAIKRKNFDYSYCYNYDFLEHVNYKFPADDGTTTKR